MRSEVQQKFGVVGRLFASERIYCQEEGLWMSMRTIYRIKKIEVLLFLKIGYSPMRKLSGVTTGSTAGKFYGSVAQIWRCGPKEITDGSCSGSKAHTVFLPVQALSVLLFMTIFPKALFALVRRNFMTFTFFSARHTAASL
jgi:hypothetical protein